MALSYVKLKKTVLLSFLVLFSFSTPATFNFSSINFEKVCLGSMALITVAFFGVSINEILRNTERTTDLSKEFENNSQISGEEKKIITEKISSLGLWKASKELRKNYLEHVRKYPFGIKTESSIDLENAKKVLDLSHSGLHDVKETILDYLAGIKMNGGNSHKVLCLSGPPGIGKTTVAKSISDALGKKFSKISFGSVATLSAQGSGQYEELSGPGPLAKALMSAESLNPVILLDELDKASHELLPQLLQILDSAQNKTFKDNYLGFNLDLSNVTFIATANNLSKVNRALLDRMQILELHPYSKKERLEIGRNKLVPEIASEMKSSPEITQKLHDLVEPLLDKVISNEAGVRSLKRYLITAAEKYARQQVSLPEGESLVDLNVQDVIKTQNPEMLQFSPAFEIASDRAIGVANGMYAAGTNGGGLLKIESISVPHGSGNLTANKLQGDFSTEAQNRVFAYVKSVAADYGISPEILKNNDFMFGDQLYAPVDGPSAGLAHAASLISTLTNRSINQKISMTGAIDMHGNVLPVNGYRDKILGCEQSGIQSVILPIAAKPVIDAIKHDFPNLTIFYVSTVPQALEILFEGGKSCD
jgi:ATP-dependent Lon protease